MVLYPDTMRRAQAEIDHVVGQKRLPSISDFGNLPYVAALVREVSARLTLDWGPCASSILRDVDRGSGVVGGADEDATRGAVDGARGRVKGDKGQAVDVAVVAGGVAGDGDVGAHGLEGVDFLEGLAGVCALP